MSQNANIELMLGSIDVRRVCQLAGFLLLIATSCESQAQFPRCSYGRALYGWDSYLVSGASCQHCLGDHWQTIDTLNFYDPRCFRSDSPTNPSPKLLDAANACASDKGGVFSEGAARLEDKQCWTCSRSAWIKADAVKFCGVARGIDEQRVVSSPVLPRDYEGPRAEGIPAFKMISSLIREEFTTLEVMIDTTTQNREQLKDGSWSLELLFDGYSHILPFTEQWNQQLAIIHKWRKQSPRSSAAALVEARYWITYALIARGQGPWANVPANARRNVNQRAATARSVLEASRPYAERNPLWYHEMLVVARLQRWPEQKKAALFDIAVKRQPAFDPIYVAMATSFAPDWGGSLAQYQRFVDTAVEITRPINRESMYATLYWNLTRVEKNSAPFGELDIPWMQMKVGFVALLERYPESDWNLQNFASFACQAGDAATFLTLLPKLMESPVSKVGGAWTGSFTFDYCRSIYTKRA